jgi:hypothetical protein
MYGDPLLEPVPPNIRLQRFSDTWNDLEGVRLDLLIYRSYGQGEEACICTDVEEDVGFFRESGDRVKRETVVREGPSSMAPEQFLGVLTPSRIEHDERRVPDSTCNFLQTGRGGPPT